MSTDSKGPHTKAIHAGLDPQEHHGAVSVPIYQVSTFAFPSAEEGAARFAGTSRGPVYTRIGNPTVQALEACVAELEHGAGAIATATGMAAISTTFLALLRAGDHVVCTHPLYGSSANLLSNNLARFGIRGTFVPAPHTSAIAEAIRPETRMVFAETPANPTLDLVDLQALAGITRRAGIPLVVDNTFAGPHLQLPLELGADVVVHSMTKSLNGHSDVVAGVIVARDDATLRVLRASAISYGTTIDPQQAWLVLRGIRTLGMRVERAQENAMELARWLERQESLASVRFPWLPAHPQYALARRQMRGPGAIITFELRGGADAARALLNGVRLITLAVSLGGVESLIEHPASMTHASLSAADRQAQGITPGMVRLSVGCEDVEDLREDLAQALIVSAAEATVSSGVRETA